MPKTELGALLISRGLLTERQLDRALERQRNFGGRLGTCLLEIGALGEEDLLAVLSEQLHAPTATREDLQDLSPEMIGLLPRSTALNCSAIPFRYSTGRIDVALVDAGDLALEDELSFSMGQRIRPHIASELRIVDALHRYYGSDIPLRFRSLLETADSRQDSPAGAANGPALSPVPAYLRPGAPNSPSSVSRRRVFSPPKFDRQAIPLTPEERAALEASRGPMPELRTSAEAVAPTEGTDHELYGQRLSDAETASQIGAALIQVLAGQFPRVLLFRVSSGHEEVTGWMSHGSDLNLDWFRHYSVGLHHATVFRTLSKGAALFTGRLESTPAHKALARCWGGSLERECLLLRVAIRGKLVCAAYVDRGDAGLSDIDLDFLKKLGSMTALAFERCILRRKLQTT
ncbi:MAG: hypothetical protein GY769_14205 [bacterium]|nr:hypothetical protein [bacterium]